MSFARPLALALALAACGPAKSHPADAAIDGPIGTFVGTVIDEGSAPVASASVCVAGRADVTCATSTADGTYTIYVPGLPGDIDLAVATTAPGYLGAVALLHETSAGLLWEDVPLLSDAAARTRMATQGGFTYPTTQDGFIELDVQGATVGTLSGATARLSPPSGAGPVYANAQGMLDRALTSTSLSGYAYFGNVAPGMYTITVAATGKTCSVMVGTTVIAGDWPGTGVATTDVQVVAGAMTRRVNVRCV